MGLRNEKVLASSVGVRNNGVLATKRGLVYVDNVRDTVSDKDLEDIWDLIERET